jgi:hypothetical protein
MREGKKLNVTLWVVQVLLALFWGLASGLPKFLMPLDTLPLPIALPAWVLYFIGAAEILGALGLVLPGLTHIRPGLTPLAAAGLVLITIGATIYQLAAGQPGNAVFAVGLGLVTAFVGYGRWRLMPHRAADRRPALQPAS